MAQPIGGKSVYDFIDIPVTARATAAGGSLIATRDDDIGLAYFNPSLLNPSMDNHIIASQSLYLAGINSGYFGYANDVPKIATFQAGMEYVSYGQFQGADEIGNPTTTFNANEFALNLGGGSQRGNYCYGANMKLVYSNLGGYTSVGMGADFAVAYDDTSHKLTATLLVRNVGGELKPYYRGASPELMPFDIEAGFSKRFKHVPFRLTVTVHDLQQPNARYDDTTQTQQSSILVNDSSSTKKNTAINVVDNIARHFIFSGEIYITKYVDFDFGYNDERRAELAPNVKGGLAGFSFGLGLNIKQFKFFFARARYSASHADTQFTLEANLHDWVKKKKKTTVNNNAG